MAHTKTPDYARLDDIDVYIQSTPLSAEEEKEFSKALKAYRERHAVRETARKTTAVPKPRHWRKG